MRRRDQTVRPTTHRCQLLTSPHQGHQIDDAATLHDLRMAPNERVMLRVLLDLDRVQAREVRDEHSVGPWYGQHHLVSRPAQHHLGRWRKVR